MSTPSHKNAPPQKAKKPGPRPARTATFVPYYPDAHGAIVQPDRFDNYLIRRWLPDLGALGFAIVKVLRNRCFWNREEDILRNTVELDMDELAAVVGVSRRTLFREFAENKTLTEFFVQKTVQFQMVGNRPQQRANLYTISMGDPIHPADQERYEALVAEIEARQEAPPLPKKIVHGMQPKPKLELECQNDTQVNSSQNLESSHECQNDTHILVCQNDTHQKCHFGTPIDKLPSGDFVTKELITPSAEPGPPINPPKGESREIEDELCSSLLYALWSETLKILAKEINKPTFETHIKKLQLLSLDESTNIAKITVPSAWSREHLMKRHAVTIAEALGNIVGYAVEVNFILA